MGGDSVDSLLDELQHGDRAVVRHAVDMLVGMALQEPLLAGLLERRLDDEKTPWKWPVAYTLGRLGKASGACLDVLAAGLGSEDQDVRWATQRLLTDLGRTQTTADEMLLALARDGLPIQRRMAVYCLRDIGLTDERSAHAIVEACADPEPLVRVAAVTSLMNLRTVTAELASVLRRLIYEDADERVRNAARFVFKKLIIDKTGSLQ